MSKDEQSSNSDGDQQATPGSDPAVDKPVSVEKKQSRKAAKRAKSSSSERKERPDQAKEADSKSSSVDQNVPTQARGDEAQKDSQGNPEGSVSKDKRDSRDSRDNKGGARRRRSRGSGSDSKSSKTANDYDAAVVAKYAWKIYLAEITEEGVTMVDDKAAKELARRCFELAVTFLDEQARQS